MKALLLIVCVLLSTFNTADAVGDEEIHAKEFLDDLNTRLTENLAKQTVAEWNYESNITDENEKLQSDITAENAIFRKAKTEEIRSYNFESFEDEDLKRQFRLLSKINYEALPEAEFKEIKTAISAMQTNYANVRVCPYNKTSQCDLQLDPDLTNILRTSVDAKELEHYWVEWYDAAGTKTRKDFDTYLRLNRKAANLNNFTSGAEVWLSEYEDPMFETKMTKIIEQILPFYKQLHAYVRHSLQSKYPQIISRRGPIPIHITGNMWGQSWVALYELTVPYPKKLTTDVTNEMKRQGFTPLKMFRLSEDFYKSLGMDALPESFWQQSIFERPNDGRDLICHPSAWDFYNQTDVRAKMCTNVNMADLITVFHEMGHIYYYLQYKDQAYIYRQGANPGFHEAVGDVFALSASTLKHLRKIGLIEDFQSDEEIKINELYKTALDKIVTLIFTFTIDSYRYALFRGKVKPDEYNCEFWKIREKFSGIRPPVQRYKEDFDPPAKYHISADIEYLRYTVSYTIQFQLYKAACQLAGEYDPNDPNSNLAECDFYGSKAVGDAFKRMLSAGRSKHWSSTFKELTGQEEMDGAAVTEYFKPLYEWLVKKNRKTGAYVGWTSEFKCLSKKVNQKRTVCSSIGDLLRGLLEKISMSFRRTNK